MENNENSQKQKKPSEPIKAFGIDPNPNLPIETPTKEGDSENLAEAIAIMEMISKTHLF